MKIISEIKVKVNGELCVVPVTDDGYAIMPDGTRKRLSEQQLAAILERVKVAYLSSKNEARPLTLPDAALVTEQVVEQPVPTSALRGEDAQKNEKPKAPKPSKEPCSIKEKAKKRPGSFAGVAAILAVGIVVVVVMFFYATMRGMFSFSAYPYYA